MNFIQTVGSQGQGPCEFDYPSHIGIDNSGRIIVSETSGGRFQIVNKDGKYLCGFRTARIGGRFILKQGTEKTELIYQNFQRDYLDKPMFLILNENGKQLGSYGKHRFPNEKLNYMYAFTTDRHNNIYVHYFGQPVINKFSCSGDLLMTITYEKEKNLSDNRLSYSIAHDGNYLFALIANRNREGNERQIGGTLSVGSAGNRTLRYMEPELDDTPPDLYKLLVFDGSGCIAASHVLDIYASIIKISGDRLFVLDSNVGMKLYEYKYSIQK